VTKRDVVWGELSAQTAEFYRQSALKLQEAGVPFLVGGAYALAQYTPIVRHTKDFDVFVRPADAQRALDALAAAGYRTEMTFPHWLGKAYGGVDFVDVIFSSGNGVARVDDEWFAHASTGEVFGVPMLLCPPEEMVWSKAFIQERERFDGADVAHLIHGRGPQFDWPRLLRRFASHWRVLFSHLTMFGFIYPADRCAIPAWVMRELAGRLERELAASPPDERVCRGTLVSRAQYLIDVHALGYRDARLDPEAGMSEEEIAHWTRAIDDQDEAA
jgi:hypothetical protein